MDKYTIEKRQRDKNKLIRQKRDKEIDTNK